MLTTRVIPCLDVRDGRVVKGVRFQNLRDSGDPVERAAAYEADGADEIVMLDVSATPEGRRTAAETVRRLRGALSIPLTVGGGVSSVDDASRLLDAGADKVAVNTAAVRRPGLISELAGTFGAQCVVLAIDAGAGPGGSFPVFVRSGGEGTSLDAREWALRGQQLGAGEVLLTSMRADGTQRGYDLELLRAVAGTVGVPVIASGGASSAADMVSAVSAGADAVLAASILHDGLTTVRALKAELSRAGVRVRMEAGAC